MDSKEFSIWVSLLALAISCLNFWLSRRWALENDFRASVREIAMTADQILLERDLTKKKGDRLRGALRDLATFSGHIGNSSRFDVAMESVERRVTMAEELASKARAFQEPDRMLDRSDPDTVNMLRVAFIAEMGRVRAIREELDDEYVGIEKQNAEYRQQVLKR